MLDIPQLTAEDLADRTPLYHPDVPFMVVRSQKAAATSTARWFFLQAGIDLSDIVRTVARTHRYRRRVFLRRDGYIDDVLAAIRNGMPVIKFVRDPYARAYSIYVACCGGRLRSSRSPWFERTRTQFCIDTGGKDEYERTFSFREFLQWLSNKIPADVNLHVRPQWMARDERMAMRICRIEQLADVLSGLEREFRLPHKASEHPDILESGHHTRKHELDRDAVLAEIEKPLPRRTDKNASYPKFNRDIAVGSDYERLVRQFYGCDVERYGY